MATTQDILTAPQSGYNYIDALLAQGPAWNYLTSDGSHFRTTLYYTFATDGSQYETGVQGFNASQQAAAQQILAYVSQLTGITFAQAASGATADIHFGQASLAEPGLDGICYAPYSYTANAAGQLTSYSADAYIYLDTKQAANQNPVAGSWGYEALLHEVGHALGLKHPFEGSVTLQSPYQDDTAHTVMAYTNDTGSYYSTFNEYDIAALNYLYGGDGLRGQWGVGSNGLYLTGSAQNQTFTLPPGRVTLADEGGADTVLYSGSEADYTITPLRGKQWLEVKGQGMDDLISANVEQLAFSDATASVQDLLNPKGQFIFGADGGQQLLGTAGPDMIFGGNGNDTLIGGAGDDFLSGGPGLDTAVFSENRGDATLTHAGGTWIMSDYYRDVTMVSVERLQFNDGKVALDLAPDEDGGMAALVVGAAAGVATLADGSAVGTVISLFDSGESMTQVCSQLTASSWFKTATRGTDDGLVDLLYHNLTGGAMTATAHQNALDLLQGHGGTMSQADLLAMVALSPDNQARINLAGLQQTGLNYLG